MPLGQYQGIPRADPGGRVTPRFWHRLIRFRRFCSGSLALASLDRACLSFCSDLTATLTTTAFDRSSLQWLEISTCLPNPKGPPSSLVQLRATVWTGHARDTRPIRTLMVLPDAQVSPDQAIPFSPAHNCTRLVGSMGRTSGQLRWDRVSSLTWINVFEQEPGRRSRSARPPRPPRRFGESLVHAVEQQPRPPCKTPPPLAQRTRSSRYHGCFSSQLALASGRCPPPDTKTMLILRRALSVCHTRGREIPRFLFAIRRRLASYARGTAPSCTNHSCPKCCQRVTHLHIDGKLVHGEFG